MCVCICINTAGQQKAFLCVCVWGGGGGGVMNVMMHPHNVSVFFDFIVYTRFVSVHAEYSFPYTNSM